MSNIFLPKGDPGNSRFFLSLDDSMMKTFGADRMRKVMESFRVAEDVPLEAKMVTDAIDKVWDSASMSVVSGTLSVVSVADFILKKGCWWLHPLGWCLWSACVNMV